MRASIEEVRQLVSKWRSESALISGRFDGNGITSEFTVLVTDLTPTQIVADLGGKYKLTLELEAWAWDYHDARESGVKLPDHLESSVLIAHSPAGKCFLFQAPERVDGVPLNRAY